MYAAIDIETIERPIAEEALAAEEARLIEKLTQQYKKDETIKAHLVDGMQAYKDKWKFSRQGCQVICVGVALWTSDRERTQVYTYYDDNERIVVNDSLKLISEQDPLKIFSYNGDSFDWPILLAKAMQHKVQLKRVLDPRTFYDLIKYPLERFQSKAIKFDELCALCGVGVETPVLDGIEPPYDGSKVAEMYALDKVDGGRRVAAYCSWDVMKTAMFAQRLMGVMGV